MRFDVITIFPDMFEGFMKESLLKRAREDKLIDIQIHNLRDFATDKHNTVDDTPYGGGPGMVFKIEPMYNAIKKVKLKGKKKVKIIYLTPRGEMFVQKTAQKWSKLDQIIILTGRYEGVDERVAELADESVSVGEYVLLGGEIPAMAIVEATARPTRLVCNTGNRGRRQSKGGTSHPRARHAGHDDGRGLLPDLALDVTLEDEIMIERIFFRYEG